MKLLWWRIVFFLDAFNAGIPMREVPDFIDFALVLKTARRAER